MTLPDYRQQIRPGGGKRLWRLLVEHSSVGAGAAGSISPLERKFQFGYDNEPLNHLCC